MQEQISDLSVQPSVLSVPSVKLWSSGFIALVILFMGFPAGIVLAAINWLRMKMTDRAVAHLIAGAVGTVIFMVGLIMLPGSMGRLLAIAVNLIILFYLRQRMRNDIKSFQTTNTVENAGWPGGCLIGLGMVLLYFLLGVFLVFVFVFLNVPIAD